MFDHVSIGVSDIKRAGKFYDAVLKPLDVTRLSDGDTALGYGERHAGEGRHGIGPALLLPGQEPRGGRRLSCRGAQDGRQGQRQAWRARRLQPELLRRLRDRSRRLPDRGLLRQVADAQPASSTMSRMRRASVSITNGLVRICM